MFCYYDKDYDEYFRNYEEEGTTYLGKRDISWSSYLQELLQRNVDIHLSMFVSTEVVERKYEWNISSMTDDLSIYDC